MKNKVNFRFFSAAIAVAVIFSSCQKVSETDGMVSLTHIFPAEETSIALAETSQTVSVPSSAVTSPQPESSETSQTVTAEETASETATTAAETVTETEITKITIQYESPSEPVTMPTVTTEETAVKTAVAGVTDINPDRGGSTYRAVNFAEQKGFWITYLEYMSILKNKSASSFKTSVETYFDNISALGFNTVYVQVRAFGDAYYNSALFPSGEQFDGNIGTKNSFDALQIMIDCAHARGLSLHAWVNPMRLMTAAQMENIDNSYQIKKWYANKNGTHIVETNGRLYLNPAYSEVTDLIADGIAEIVSNYDVDGIQIDDYFYPTTEASFDKSAYSSSGTSLSLSDWRISNVNKMVKKLYSAVHNANDTVIFGISPQGSLENNYDELYADVKTWCAESGYCDYILPQVYFGFENAALPYSRVIDEWSGMVTNPRVQLVIGLAAYKIGAADGYAGASGKNEWLNNTDIMARQIAAARGLPNYGGVALYRYESLFKPSKDVSAAVNKELENIRK
ncbi:MAG: family 10 glycosylhydrolase [Ruminococcus sp.]|nr:family 10 glycosylhydrolase [Ruminococcus sp.]MCM1480575.1 family 10 glycosylhydrolase [Muribaculaceae bacterium]